MVIILIIIKHIAVIERALHKMSLPLVGFVVQQLDSICSYLSGLVGKPDGKK